MKRCSTGFVSGLFLCFAGAVCGATVAEQPYQIIAKRNVFDLNPPQEPPRLEKVAPMPKFRLAGTATYGGVRVFVEVQVPARPGERPNARSFMLREGERDGELEIVKIDLAHGCADIKWSGRPVTIKFE